VTTPDHPEVAEGDDCPALPVRDPRQEARDTLRVPRLLVVRGGDYMSDESGRSVHSCTRKRSHERRVGESVAFVASVAACLHRRSDGADAIARFAGFWQKVRSAHG